MSSKISSAPKCPSRSFVKRTFVLFTPKGQLEFPSMELLHSYVDQFNENFKDLRIPDSKVFCVDIYELKKPFEK